jgi:hypothetical protein
MSYVTLWMPLDRIDPEGQRGGMAWVAGDVLLERFLYHLFLASLG